MQLGDSGKFQTLDAGKILHGDLGRRVNVIEEQLATQRKMVKGRQIAHIVFHRYELSATEGAVLEFSDLISVERDNLAVFLNDWEYTTCGMKSTPPADIMETLLIKQLRKCGHLKEHLALYELE
eukprot:10793938-Karenia_brevis.AAC.1